MAPKLNFPFLFPKCKHNHKVIPHVIRCNSTLEWDCSSERILLVAAIVHLSFDVKFRMGGLVVADYSHELFFLLLLLFHCTVPTDSKCFSTIYFFIVFFT